MKIKIIILIIICSATVLPTAGQEKEENSIDTNYIRTFPNIIHGRLYLSRKYTNMEISPTKNTSNLLYEPNTNVNLGVGFTIKSFTLNLAYGFNFLNNETEGKGETKHLDLQTHIYKRKYIIDFFGQLYSGMFLSNTDKLVEVPLDSIEENRYYLRPDIKIKLFSLNALKVFNSERFSYAAPFVQNEQQKKSAGSFLLGLKGSYLNSSADSSYLPYFSVDSLYGDLGGVKFMEAIQLGPSTGYAYSLIIARRYFLTASLNLSITTGPVSYMSLENKSRTEWQVNVNAGVRLAAGYNSRNKYFGLYFLQGNNQIKGFDDVAHAIVSAGNVRLIYIKRFKVGARLKKQIERLPF